VQRDPLAGLKDDLGKQRVFVGARAPVYERLLGHLITLADGPLAEPLREAWHLRTFGAYYERPLLILASLRDDVLAEGTAHPLWTALGTGSPDPSCVTNDTVRTAFDAERVWQNLRSRFVQTNDPSRGVTWLWPAAMWRSARGVRNMTLVEAGTSAGLNLIADKLPPVWSDTQRNELTLSPLPEITGRVGYDLRPLDVRNETDARWLRACIWPGQPERADRLEEAIRTFREAARSGERVETAQATAADIPALLPHPAAEAPVLVFQSIVRDYLPASECSAFEAGMNQWLQSAPAGSALWVELEMAEESRSDLPPSHITAHVRGSDRLQVLTLARCEPHPQLLQVDHAGHEQFLKWMEAFRN